MRREGQHLPDDHRTFQYLDIGNNSTYVPAESVDVLAVRRACDEVQVSFRNAPPDGYPSIECLVGPSDSVADAVARVAEAVGRVFQLALREDLR
ncbi:MAG: hypothetical protein HN341_16165 [Verrucomicrobia bacterium]|nr:hypothetical protein [Verrucomicrobiota bacterium]